MHLSLNWLKRHIDLEGLTPEQIALDLTLSTAEVEGLERFCPHLDDVTVGFVKERVPHPDADKLNICRWMSEPKKSCRSFAAHPISTRAKRLRLLLSELSCRVTSRSRSPRFAASSRAA